TLPAQSRKRLEVKKDSDIYYFAPFFESFVVGEATPQDVNVQATLYFVPKPTADVAAAEPEPAATPAPAAEPPPGAEVATEVPAEEPGKIEEEDLPATSLPAFVPPVASVSDQDPLDATDEGTGDEVADTASDDDEELAATD